MIVLWLATGILAQAGDGIAQSEATGGSYNFASPSRRKRQEDEIPERKAPIEVKVIRTAAGPVVTGIVEPRPVYKPSYATLEALARSEFRATRLRKAQIRALQLSDDEWLMTT